MAGALTSLSSFLFVISAHSSYSRESDERDGMVEQGAVWASCFLLWTDAGAGWAADAGVGVLSLSGSG